MDDTQRPDPQGALGERAGPQVGPEAAYRLVSRDGYAYVDVRDAEEFEEGRPAGAVSFPFSASAIAEFIAAIHSHFQVDSKLVVGCNSGKRSPLAVRALTESGFVNVVECRTGWDGARGIFGELREPGWRRVGLPTENGSPKRS
jgi:rhodanese-related sulfurtransferase